MKRNDQSPNPMKVLHQATHVHNSAHIPPPAARTRVLWFDDIFNMFLPIPYPLTALLLGAISWGVAALFLAVGSQIHLVNDLPMVLGFIGISACFAFARWGSLNYLHAINPIERILGDQPSTDAFQRAKATTLRRFSNTRETIIVVLLLWLVASAALSICWIGGRSVGQIVPIFDFMSRDWYATTGVAWRLSAVIAMAFPVTAIMWTGGRVLILHTLFILSLRKMRFIPSPATCVRILRPALTLGVVASLFWSFGVALFVILFRDRMSVDRLLFLLILAAIGSFGFVVPILGLHSNLLEICQQRLDQLTLVIIEKVKGLHPDAALLEELNELERRAEQSSSLGPLVMGWRYIAWFATVVIIPIGIGVVQLILGTLVTTPAP